MSEHEVPGVHVASIRLLVVVWIGLMIGTWLTVAASNVDLGWLNIWIGLAIATAKAANMPNDNIDRAIKRGTGDQDGVSYEEKVYAGFYGGVAILVNALTDNNNRTTAEVRHAFNKFNGKMVDTGSASIYFERKGIIVIDESAADEETVMEVVLDAGAEDVETEEGAVTVTTPRAPPPRCFR